MRSLFANRATAFVITAYRRRGVGRMFAAARLHPARSLRGGRSATPQSEESRL